MTPPDGLTRRQLVAAAITSFACAALAEEARAEVPSLGALARLSGIDFGSAFDLEAIEDAEYGALIRRHSTHTGNTNAFKYDWLRNTGPEADFTRADRLLGFAEAAGLPFTAAVLFWNDWPPEWLKRESLARIRYLFDAHIDEVLPRYSGRVAQWVIVNEPFSPWDKEPGVWRKGPWYAAFGPSYVDRAFKRARAADPKARLMLNEAFCERRDWIGAAVRPALLALVERMKDTGVPLDRVGLQGHLQPQFGLDHRDYVHLMRRLASFGVTLEITELDVDDVDMGGTLADRDGEVARHYREFLDAVLTVPQLAGITTWGLADRHTWYHEVAKAENALFPRQPRPLPFDDRLQPKPAYAAIAAAFRAAARRR